MLAVIAAAGLFLTHYRVAIIYAGFAGLYLLWLVFAGLLAREPRTQVWAPVGRAALVAVLTVAALSPWLVNLWQNFGSRFVGKNSPVAEGYYSLDNMGLLPLLGHPSVPLMLLLSLGGIVWAARRRDPLPLLPALAWLLLGLWSNPFLLPIRLPYSGYLDATTLAIGVWLPLALLAGYSLSQVGAWLLRVADSHSGTPKQLWRAGALSVLALFVLVGGGASGLRLATMLDF
jgi:hypothetical protein